VRAVIIAEKMKAFWANSFVLPDRKDEYYPGNIFYAHHALAGCEI
jgi:hypothetical protein